MMLLHFNISLYVLGQLHYAFFVCVKGTQHSLECNLVSMLGHHYRWFSLISKVQSNFATQVQQSELVDY